MIGYILLLKTPENTDFSDQIEIGWMLHKDHWNKGYVTEAAKAGLDYAFKKLNQEEIFAYTTHQNLASLKVMEKLGMVFRHEFDLPRLGENHPLNPCILYSIHK